MTDDEESTCYMCPTTEEENGSPLVYLDWLQAKLCDECAIYFGMVVGDEE